MKLPAALFLLFISLNIHAQPGQPDPTFGVNGVSLGPFTSQSNSSYYIALQSNGKLLSVGDQYVNGNESMFVLRYNSNGTIDANFGTAGVITDSLPYLNHVALAVTEQNDGKIVVVGTVEDLLARDIFIKRYDSTGVTDTSFGQAGIVITDYMNNSDDVALDLKIQPDGKIVLCGITDDFNETNVLLLRYNNNGTLDSTFGTGGKVSTNLGSDEQGVVSMALQPDGRIVVGGVISDLVNDYNVLVMRYNINGTIDTSFGSFGLGYYTIDIAQTSDEIYSIALQADGKILAAGLTENFSGFDDDLLIRLDSTGLPDPTFHGNGFIIRDYNGGYSAIYKVMLQSDDKIVTAGYQSSVTEDISLSRYLSNGTVDSTYGMNGNITHSIGIEDEFPHYALMQSDDKVVVTGSYSDSGLENVFAARYQNDSLLNSIDRIYETSLQIYPQPATSIIHLINADEGSHYSIIDLNGRIVCNGETKPVIDIRNLENGIYFIRLNSDKKEIVKRFVKM